MFVSGNVCIACGCWGAMGLGSRANQSTSASDASALTGVVRCDSRQRRLAGESRRILQCARENERVQASENVGGQASRVSDTVGCGRASSHRATRRRDWRGLCRLAAVSRWCRGQVAQTVVRRGGRLQGGCGLLKIEREREEEDGDNSDCWEEGQADRAAPARARRGDGGPSWAEGGGVLGWWWN